MVELQLILNPNMPKPLELEKSIPFFDELKITKCKHCNTPFSRNDPIIHYQHPSGWIVPGFEKKQWLFIVCPKCEHQWSLWKLGVGKNLLPVQHKTEEERQKLWKLWKDKSHPTTIETTSNQFSSEMLLNDLNKACLEKVALQQQLGQIQVSIENRLIDLAQHDPDWKVDYIPEEMQKRESEIKFLNSILNLLKSH
jgi:hypothetical protein